MGAGAAVDPTPSQFRRKWGTDRHHLPTRHPEPGSSRVGGQTRRPRAPGGGYPARPGQNLMVRATASRKGPATLPYGVSTDSRID